MPFEYPDVFDDEVLVDDNDTCTCQVCMEYGWHSTIAIFNYGAKHGVRLQYAGKVHI